MWRSIRQIIGILILLVAMLMLPAIIKSHSPKNKINTTSSIAPEGVSTSNVLGVSTAPTSSDLSGKDLDSFDFSQIKKYAIYTIEVLFVISVLSFIKFKYLKDKNGIK